MDVYEKLSKFKEKMLFMEKNCRIDV